MSWVYVWRLIADIIAKMTSIKKRKVVLYLSGIFIFIHVAATIRRAPQTVDPQIHEKILAFKEAGAEKKVNTDHYNIEEAIEYSESFLGTPHTMGGYSRSGLDCSGLVRLVHEKFDVVLPHSSQEQARYGAIISPGEDLKRGDLVFFHSTYETSNLVTHSGIYLGDNKFIHTSTSRGVCISMVLDSGYWQQHYLFATRLDK